MLHVLLAPAPRTLMRHGCGGVVLERTEVRAEHIPTAMMMGLCHATRREVTPPRGVLSLLDRI